MKWNFEMCIRDRYTDGLNFIEEYRGNLDIVFLDIEMPHMDGMTAARKLRKLDYIDLIAANIGMVIGRAIVKNRLLCFHITQSPFFKWSGSEKLAWRVAGHLFDFF